MGNFAYIQCFDLLQCLNEFISNIILTLSLNYL